MIKNFIEKLTRKKIAKNKEYMTPVELFLQAWANNLAFREFAKTYVYQHLKPTQKGIELGETLNKISDEARNIHWKQKSGRATPEDLVRYEELNKQKKELALILSQRGFVKREDVPRYQSLEVELHGTVSKEINRLNTQRAKLKDEIEKMRGMVSKAEKLVAENDQILSSPAFDQARQQKKALFEQMMAADGTVRQLSRKYMHENFNYETGRFKENLFDKLDSKVATAFGVFDKTSAVYQAYLKTHDEILILEAQSGNLKINDKMNDKQEVTHQTLTDLHNAIETLVSSRPVLHEMYRRAVEYDQQISVLASRAYELEKEMATLTGGDYFIPEYRTAMDLFEQVRQHQSGEKDELAGITQKIWAEWSRLWAARIVVESSDSAY